MSNTPKPEPVSAEEALKCLEEAWAYFTPMPALVAKDAPAGDVPWMPYYDAA